MARRTLDDLYAEARTYLDTDDLNFPTDLCHLLMRRVWFQAVNMEREWRFLLCDGFVDVPAFTSRIPLRFTCTGLAGQPQRDAARLDWVAWGDPAVALALQSQWVRVIGTWGVTPSASGVPEAWAEEQDSGVRYLRLGPPPATDGRLNVSMVLIPEFPSDTTQALVDLPEEFDDALLQALLAEMYMREEDGDLYQFQRSMFMEQMGSIKERWRVSNTDRLVMAGDAKTRAHMQEFRKPKLTDSGWP